MRWGGSREPPPTRILPAKLQDFAGEALPCRALAREGPVSTGATLGHPLGFGGQRCPLPATGPLARLARASAPGCARLPGSEAHPRGDGAVRSPSARAHRRGVGSNPVAANRFPNSSNTAPRIRRLGALFDTRRAPPFKLTGANLNCGCCETRCRLWVPIPR